MKVKKFLVAILSVAMIFSVVSIPAFAAGALALNASKTEVVAGDTVTITLQVPSDNTTIVGAFDADLSYDTNTFEFVSATSDFNGFMARNDVEASTVKTTAVDPVSTKAAGNVFVITFRVKADALGKEYTFDVDTSTFHIDGVDANRLYDESTTIAEAEVSVKGPEKLTTPAVTIEEATKKAMWGAVENAKTYNVVLKKGDAELYNKNTAATEFDFSKYVTETDNYTVIVTANQNGSLYLASEAGQAEQKFVIAPTVTPTEKDYIKGSGGFEVIMTLNGNTFEDIDGLTAETDYTVAGNVVKINESALAESKDLVFNFSDEQTATVTVTVKDAAAAATLVLAERAADEYKDDDTAANDGTEDGLIVVTNAAAPVTNFIGVQFSINNTADVNYDKVEYEIVPADGFALLYDADADVYEINVKPVNGTAPSISEDAAGKGIVIGKLVRKGSGYGKGTIQASNITMTVEKSDNSYAKLNADSFSFLYNIPEPVENLNVFVDFAKLPTNTDNEADYQSMKVVLYSARLGSIEMALGNDAEEYVSEDGKITASVTKAENNYKVEFKDLPAFDAYTVSISGDGYRDAKAQFVLNEETTVNFWNNANESDRVFISKPGGTEKMVTKNFLAGDIIMNNVIDLYDLSAVSSYFGKKGLTADDAQYIQYDLNRDGKVDIIDITMLLAGWSE